MLILLTNDDGIHSPGLKALYDALEGLGERWVVAPDRERSGVSHAFTLATPLRIHEVRHEGKRYGFAVNGTPVDTAKIALRRILPEKPALVVSGINHGENTGVNILYSGTVAAAMEGAITGIPSIAFSTVWQEHIDFSTPAKLARRFCEMVLERGLPHGTILNVNVPGLPESEIKGTRLTEMAQSHYVEEIPKSTDPRGRDYYWIAGKNQIVGDGARTDMIALKEGYVSVTPVTARLTDTAFLHTLRDWNLG